MKFWLNLSIVKTPNQYLFLCPFVLDFSFKKILIILTLIIPCKDCHYRFCPIHGHSTGITATANGCTLVVFLITVSGTGDLIVIAGYCSIPKSGNKESILLLWRMREKIGSNGEIRRHDKATG